MKKTLFVILIIMIAILAVSLSLNNYQKSKNQSQKISIITTLFPLYDFAKTIGGDKVEVSLLLPPGVEAHGFEPKPSDIARINEAQIFIYTGSFMEPWAEDIIKGNSNQSLEIIDASLDIKMMPGLAHHHDDEDEENDHHNEEAEVMDPHIWLDFDNDQKIVETITIALSEKDPSNAEYYQKRANDYKNTLSLLDQKYKNGLASCQSNKIIYGGHYAFGYLSNRYNLEYLAAQGISPDSEPTANDLIKMVEQIRKDNIKYVFYEELTTPKIAETIANETQAKMLLLNAAHNVSREDFENNISFISLMEYNLDNLKIGLECN